MKSEFISRIALAAALCIVASGASAASLTWSSYVEGDISDARADRAGIDSDTEIALEDFEEFAPVPFVNGNGDGDGTVGDFTPFTASVGDFTTTAGGTCGGSCSQPEDQSLVRDTSDFGRYNTTLGGNNWLDSNDNAAINLDISGLGLFDSISLFLMDVDDVGRNVFSIYVNGEEHDISSEYSSATLPGNQTDPDDSDLFLISIAFDSLIDNAFISFAIDDGDGFGMDDVRIGSSVPAVPVPATLPLLLAGIGGLGWTARRRKKA